MIDWHILILYISALVAVYIIPGPDMALLVTVSSLSGTRKGISVAFGLGGARFIHVFLSGLGLASLFNLYPVSYDVMKYAGALYLLILAFKSVRHNSKNEMIGDKKKDPSEENVFFLGFITNLLNPKALIFCSVILPQFLFSNTLLLLIQFLILGVILVLMGFFFDVFYSFLSGRLTGFLSGKAGLIFQRLFTPLVFIFLALYTALKVI